MGYDIHEKVFFLNYEQNEYVEQYKDFNLFLKEYIGEELMAPFIPYPGMKSKFSIEVIDLKNQPDHKKLKKIQLFREYSANPENARIFKN